MEKKLQKLCIRGINGTLLGLIVGVSTMQADVQAVKIVEIPRDSNISNVYEDELCNEIEPKPTFGQKLRDYGATWFKQSFAGTIPGAIWNGSKWVYNKVNHNSSGSSELSFNNLKNESSGATEWLSDTQENEPTFGQKLRDYGATWFKQSFAGTIPGAIWNGSKWVYNKVSNEPFGANNQDRSGTYDKSEEARKSVSDAVYRKLYDVFGLKNNFNVPGNSSIRIDLVRVPRKLGYDLCHRSQECMNNLSRKLGIPVYCLELSKLTFFKKLFISNQEAPITASWFSDRSVLQKMRAIFGKNLPIEVSKAGNVINSGMFSGYFRSFDRSRTVLFIADPASDLAFLVGCNLPR